MNQYETEVRFRWGDTATYREHEQKTKNYTKEKWAEANEGLMTIFAEFAVCKDSGASADSVEAQLYKLFIIGEQVMAWIISANSKMYDHASAFAVFGFIDWRQRAKYKIGDTVYIYCTKPIQKVMYKCEVVQSDKQFEDCVDDSAFWKDIDEYKKSQDGKYARLKLISQVDSKMLKYEYLEEKGLNGRVQGPRRVPTELEKYIEKYFNDYYSKGVFNDVDTEEQYHEGHVINAKVNRYERSSIARMKCIEYHGAKCSICGINFGKKYGELGEGFIHVHHLKPLHSIGQDYVVNYKNDLIPVCPNCHAMIHRIKNGESMTVVELRKVLGETND